MHCVSYLKLHIQTGSCCTLCKELGSAIDGSLEHKCAYPLPGHVGHDDDDCKVKVVIMFQYCKNVHIHRCFRKEKNKTTLQLNSHFQCFFLFCICHIAANLCYCFIFLWCQITAESPFLFFCPESFTKRETKEKK